MQLPSFLISSFSRRVDSFERMLKVAFASCGGEMGHSGYHRVMGEGNIQFNQSHLEFYFQFVNLVSGRVQSLQFDLFKERKLVTGGFLPVPICVINS